MDHSSIQQAVTEKRKNDREERKQLDGGGGNSPRNDGRSIKSNRVPLAVRLDKLRNEKTEDFIAEITRFQNVRRGPLGNSRTLNNRPPSSNNSNMRPQSAISNATCTLFKSI